jgi:hypothetical protein
MAGKITVWGIFQDAMFARGFLSHDLIFIQKIMHITH